jgi:hypothetical protein
VVYDLTQSHPLVSSPNTKGCKCNLQFVKVISRPFQVVGDLKGILYNVPNLKVIQRPMIIDPLVKIFLITGCN